MDAIREQNPSWFKNAVIYQLHVKGFYDSRDDGIGDFAGLNKKLDYIESLGITAIWLLPFFPSPLKDDGYDISNYLDVHHLYGTLQDFRDFLAAAHERGIRVIIELVINHTSDQHFWFQRARRAPKGSSWRQFYIWSDTPDRYKEARIIFKDFETSNWAWDPIAESYYFHRFYSHQPDLNFANFQVQKEIFRALDFWLEMGVDGLRLDAVPYLFEKEGTNCENLPETHEFIKRLRKHVDSKYTDRVLIAEANQWPEDAAAYFGEADECHMAFHFPLMPRLFMAIQMEDRFPIIDILEQTPHLPSSCQWIMFLRNHDELTLEMVSDEERDYMYRIYAKDPKARINLGIRRRLAPLLDNDRAKIELMNVLLFSLPGTPVIYYGDEIGMGDNYYLGDRNGVRTPMQWNSDRNAGFSKANPQKLYLPVIIDPSYHYELLNVDIKEHNYSSLLWWIRRALAVRKNYKAFGSGALEFIGNDNHKILAYTRMYGDEIILVVANLSRFSQATELNLAKYAGHTPYEMFHQSPFPLIKETPYTVTLGPYGYFWLSLKPSQSMVSLKMKGEEVKFTVLRKWEQVFSGNHKKRLETEILPEFIRKARWFEHKTLSIRHTKIIEALAFARSMLCIVEVFYYEREETELYLLPISFSKKIGDVKDLNVITSLQVDEVEGYLYDSIHDESFRKALLQFIVQARKLKKLSSITQKGLRNEQAKTLVELGSRIVHAEQSNSSCIYGEKFFLKLYRRLEEGIHPEVEIEQFLTERANFQHISKFVGSIQWKQLDKSSTTLALLQEYVPNEGTAWDFTLDTLTHFYEQVLTTNDQEIEALIGGRYLEAARMIGERSAQMHLALSSDLEHTDFNPESFSYFYQRSLYQDIRNNLRSTFHLIKSQIGNVPEDCQAIVLEVLQLEHEILNLFQKILKKPFSLVRIRIHGDYHLGQLLYTGKDFLIIDFEGEPLDPLTVRRRKRTALRDVAGILRSFHYASLKALVGNSAIRPESIPNLEKWAKKWYKHVSKIFIQAYQEEIRKSPLNLVPKDENDFSYLLQVFMLNKAIYELRYEFDVRPDWLIIPCKGILSILALGEGKCL